MARLRSDFPAACLLPGLVAGQLVFQLADPALPAAALGLTLLLLASVLFKRAEIVWLSVLVGAVSTLPGALNRSTTALHSDRSYLAVLLEKPRRRRTNQLELQLLIRELTPSGRPGLFQSVGQVQVLCKAVDLPWKNLSGVETGSRFIMRGAFRPLQRTRDPFTYESTLRRRGFDATCKLRYASRPQKWRRPGAAHVLRRATIDTVLRVGGDSELSGLFLSMSIGARDMISMEAEEAFKRTGLAHLLVVSGYQVTLVYYSLLFLLRCLLTLSPRLCLRLPVRQLSAVAALSGALFFVWLTGVEGSSLRAALAIIFVVVGFCFERAGGMLNSICFSFLLLALIWPGAYLEPGLQLTYAALLGLALARSDQPPLTAYLTACLAASLFTSLVVLIWFEQFSLLGFVLNPLIAPAASWLSCKAGLVALAATVIDPHALLLRGILAAIDHFRALVLWLAKFPFAAVILGGWAKWFAVLALGAAALCVLARRAMWYLVEHELIDPRRNITRPTLHNVR